MNKVKGLETSVQKSQESYQIDSNLQELLIEAKALFEELDKCSAQIRALEKELQRVNAKFPFKLKLKESEESLYMPPHDRHVQWCPNGTVRGYTQQEFDFLSWEMEDSAKNFRFFLVIEEKEFVLLEDAQSPGLRREFLSQIKFKKPVIELDMATRLHYCEYRNYFIQSFKEYLRNHRIAIEMGTFFK
jgi:hypothetical protein